MPGVRTVTSLPDGPPPARCLLGFKPQKLPEIAPGLVPRRSAETVLVSMLAGVGADTLRALFPTVGAVVRIMPNLPVSERHGVVALFSADADEELRRRMKALFGLLGSALWADSEAEFAAIGSVAGTGPAYVARFVAALAKAGVGRGLSQQVAADIALDTALGTALMASEHGEAMDSIVRRVASPGGTTEAGLGVLDAELDALLVRTIAASARRGEELAAAARAIDSPGALP